MNVILTSNRCDAPVLDYAEDPRTADIFADPSACQYISKENGLQQAATSIKVMMSAHKNMYNDIRCFYAISDTANFDPKFIPFPGFTNIDNRGEIINKAANDGRSDIFVPYSDASGFVSSELDYRDMTWSIENLPKFTVYRIKVVLASTNQVYVPRISALRAICLA